jgi:hypothetical protein
MGGGVGVLIDRELIVNPKIASNNFHTSSI